MKCNNCEAELEEGVTLCPECGCENAPAEEILEETAPVAETPEEPSEQEQEETVPAEEPLTEKETTPIVEGKLSGGKIALLVVLAVAAIAVVVALIVSGMSGNDVVETTQTTTETTAEATEATDETETSEATVPADGNPDDVTCKGTYTASDDEVLAAKDTVIATLGDAELTISELQVYYWNQFYQLMDECNTYASYYGMDTVTFASTYMGLDYTQPLDTQISASGEYTWQQEFLNSALQVWYAQAALAQQAEGSDWEMDEEYVQYLDGLAQTLEDNALTYGFENALAMMEADMGKGTTVEAYIQYMKETYTSGMYFNHLCDQIEVTDADVEAYFDENAATYAESGLEKNDEEIYVDARHILVMPQGGTTDDAGNTTYSEEEWETCRESAQAILDEWKAGDADEATFAALANARSEDGGSNTNGGLYENIYVGQMVEPFETWCFDTSRQYGDTGLVKTDYGYHVMYFVDSTPIWYYTAENALIAEMQNQLRDDAMAAYELNVDYSSILLNTVDFLGEG